MCVKKKSEQPSAESLQRHVFEYRLYGEQGETFKLMLSISISEQKRFGLFNISTGLSFSGKVFQSYTLHRASQPLALRIKVCTFK